ncbi:MAG TPA: hypothetical protein VG839_04350 [Asticcacaulis sp.]|nr:hypothetical protein [Asticcacaulis sp.]
MALDPRLVFGARDITDPIRRTLNLPRGVWQMVLSEDLRQVTYMDRYDRVRNSAITDLTRVALQRLLQLEPV